MALNPSPEDRVLFDRIYRDYRKYVLFEAYKVVKNSADANDIAQSVFMKLWETGKYRDIMWSVKRFLETTTYRKSLDFIESQKFKTNTQKEFEELATLAEEHRLSEEITAGNEISLQTAAFWKAFANLTKRQQDVLRFLYVEGKKYNEVATLMGISKNTVKDTKLWAVNNIRKIIGHLTLDLDEIRRSSIF